MKISFVIPHYGQSGLLWNCLNSIKDYMPDTEIIVVDDHTEDISIPRLCTSFGVKLIINQENLGFSKTCNRGAREATGDVIIFLNNDITLTCDFSKAIEEDMEDPLVGVVGALLYYPDGKIQHAGVWAFLQSVCHFAHHKDPIKTPGVFFSKYCYSVTGALYAIKKDLWELLGGFPEEYRNSCEDSIMSLRVWQRGFRVLYDPRVTAIHHEGATRGSTNETKKKTGNSIDEQKNIGLMFKEMNEKRFEETIRSVASANAMRRKAETMHVAIKRTMARGDVLKVEGLIIPLKRLGYKVSIITNYPELFQGNANLEGLYTSCDECPTPFIINLDYVYELNPEISIQEAYRIEINNYIYSPIEEVGRNHIYYTAFDVASMNEKLQGFDYQKPYIVIHPSKSNASRCWPRESWITICKEILIKHKIQVVSIGTSADWQFGGSVVDASNKLTLQESCALIGGASLFIGMDSGMLHVAETTRTPCIGIFTSVDPAKRLSKRRNGDITIHISPNIPCKYCVERQPTPLTHCPPCSNNYECVKAIKPEHIMKVVDEILVKKHE